MNSSKGNELEKFRGCYNIRFSAEKSSREAILFLHGFPAEISNKNIDIAERLSADLHIDTFLLHYHGLGQSEGHFNFLRSIRDSIAYAQRLLTRYSYTRLHLVGHSWGGLVALNVYRSLGKQRGRIALLAPYTWMETEDAVRNAARFFLRKHPHLFDGQNLNSVSADLEYVRRHHNPREITRSINTNININSPVFIVHALGDDVIPREMNLTLLETFKTRPLYFELESDHRFVRNREKLIDALRDFFAPK